MPGELFLSGRKGVLQQSKYSEGKKCAHPRSLYGGQTRNEPARRQERLVATALVIPSVVVGVIIRVLGVQLAAPRAIHHNPKHVVFAQGLHGSCNRVNRSGANTDNNYRTGGQG